MAELAKLKPFIGGMSVPEPVEEGGRDELQPETRVERTVRKKKEQQHKKSKSREQQIEELNRSSITMKDDVPTTGAGAGLRSGVAKLMHRQSAKTIAQLEQTPSSSFNIAEARREFKKYGALHLFKRKELARKLSTRAFEIGPDLSLSEDKIDELIMKMLDPKSGIPIRKHTRALKAYDNTFTGRDAMKWVTENLHWSHDEAIQKLQTIFMNRRVFRSVTPKYTSFHDKKSAFYRFRLTENDPNGVQCLNDVKEYTGEIEDPCRLSEELADMAINLMLIPHRRDNFGAIMPSSLFRRFWLKTTKLQNVSIDKMTNAEKNVFFLNVHNILMVHNCILHNPPKNKLEMKQTLTKTYRIGKHHYSLQLIKLILSGKLPDEMPLPKDDIQLSPANPMVYFCMFNCTDQSPSLRSYSVPDFEDMAAQQAKQFLAEHVELRTEFNQIWLPRLLSDRVKDFGQDEKDMLLNLAKYLPRRERIFIENNLDLLEVMYKDSTFKSVIFLKENLRNDSSN